MMIFPRFKDPVESKIESLIIQWNFHSFVIVLPIFNSLLISINKI